MKKLIYVIPVFIIVFSSIKSSAQFRKKYEVIIDYHDFDKLYNKHDFYGDIFRYNQKNSTNKTRIQSVKKGEFPQNGIKLDVNLFRNESIELKFYLSRKGKDDKIDTYHQTITSEELELNGRIDFSLSSKDWNNKSYSTEEFMNYLASLIQTREQEVIMDASLHSKLTSLPLGTFIFIDKENLQNIQQYRIPEFNEIKIDSSIPQSALMMKYSKVVSKEMDGSIHASFSQNKIMASVKSVVESSDFVELSMNLDKFHRKYVENVGAVHFKYLTEDESKLNDWFKDKIEIINSADNKTRYELHFTTGYKLIDELKITYNSYKDLSNQTEVDLDIYEVVTAGGGAKFTKYKSVKDTLVASNYLVDVETENMTNTFYRLADFYKIKEGTHNKTKLLKSQLKYSENSIKNNIELFKSTYNDFLNQYSNKNLPIDEHFVKLDCLDNCVNKIIPISNIMKGYDIDIITLIYELYLNEKYKFLSEEEKRTRVIISSQNILKSKFYITKDIASEIVATYAAINYLNSQLNNDNPLSFKAYMEEYINSDDYKNSGRPLSKLLLGAL